VKILEAAAFAFPRSGPNCWDWPA